MSVTIADATTVDGQRVDVVADGQLIVAMQPAGATTRHPGTRDAVDARGGLLLPAFVDTHIHLDKVLIRDRLAEHDGTLRGAIDSIHDAKRRYTVDGYATEPRRSSARPC